MSGIADSKEQHPYDERPWRLARLQVSSAAHASVQVSGLGQWFPARHARIRGASSVTVADHCRTIQNDHYHVRRASISMGPLLNPTGDVRKTLRELLDKPGDLSAIHKFQDSLKPYIAPPLEEGQNRTSLSASRYYDTSVWGAAAVQLGDHSRMNIHTHCVVEDTTFQLAELLADNATLVTSFVETLLHPDDASASRLFLRSTLRAAGRSDDLWMLGHLSGDVTERSTSVWAFFGLVQVNDPTAVMLGVDNILTTNFDVDIPTVKPSTLLADLDTLRDSLGVTAPELLTSSTDLSIPDVDFDDLGEMPDFRPVAINPEVEDCTLTITTDDLPSSVLEWWYRNHPPTKPEPPNPNSGFNLGF